MRSLSRSLTSKAQIAIRMRVFVVLVLLFAACVSSKPFPSWPSRYYLEMTLALPQWQESGLGNTPQPLKAWFAAGEAERLEYWGSSDPVVNVVTKALVGWHSTWSFVKDTKRVCERNLLPDLAGLASVFPQHTDGWVYQGVQQSQDVWQRYVNTSTGATNNFTFFADAVTGQPLRYEYRGMTSTTAGYLHSPNYDYFAVQYGRFAPGLYNASVFAAPCQVDGAARKRSRGFVATEFERHMREDGPSKVFQPTRSMAELPQEVDWEALGKVVGVKDQGDCGSCYSFGSAAAVESAYAIKHNTAPIPLSEQVILDCSWSEGNNACWGGSQAGSYKALIKKFNGSWPTEAAYSYRQNPGTCKSIGGSGVQIVDYKYVVSTHALMEAVALHGPVAVAISTYPANPFTFYHQGVFSDILCQPLIPDHVVLVTGYGTDARTGERFWRMKNQWSAYWGEGGYMRITRRLDDCGVTSYGVLPIVA